MSTEHSFSIADAFERLRIVCMDCPAFAKIHYRSAPHGWGRFLWYECHDTHHLVFVNDRQMWTQHTNHKPTDVTTMLTLPHTTLVPISPNEAIDLFSQIETEMLERQEWARVLERFITTRPDRL